MAGLRPLLLGLLLPGCASHWHEEWTFGAAYSYPWYLQPYVPLITAFYCDAECDARLERAPTIDREFKALVDLLNQTTGGPRDVYRGAFQGLDEFVDAGGSLTRRQASLNTWKHMNGWDSILTAHTSKLTLCTNLKLDGNQSFTRDICYDKILASADGPLFPSCLLYTSPSPRDRQKSRMPSSA